MIDDIIDGIIAGLDKMWYWARKVASPFLFVLAVYGSLAITYSCTSGIRDGVIP